MLGFTRSLFTGQRPGRKAAYKPQFEALESRDLMAVLLSGGLVGGTTATLAPADPGVTEVPPPDPGLTLIPAALVPVDVSSQITGTFTPVGPEPTAAGLALINGLPDTPVRTAALADYQRDGFISRNDMIDILFRGTTGFTDLTDAERTSLQTLVTNGPTLAMPGYVQNLASKALAGTPNAPALKLNVDNFFLGLKHPGTNETIPATVPLWNGLPSPRDIDQPNPVKVDGQIVIQQSSSSNWLKTSLEEVAARRPTDITSMIIDNGDNTYTVRFYHGSTPDYVTVDNRFAIFFTPGVPGHDVLWPSLILKAYAQENATGLIGSPHPGGTDYAAIQDFDIDEDNPPSDTHAIVGTPAWAFSAITGNVGSTSATVDPDAIAAAWSRGDLVALHTANDYANVPELILKTDRASDLLNPRGWFALVNYVPDASEGGLFTVTQNGTRALQVPGRVLAEEFNSWADTSAFTHVAVAHLPPQLVGGLTTVPPPPAAVAPTTVQPVLVASPKPQRHRPQRPRKVALVGLVGHRTRRPGKGKSPVAAT
jgi:hypothetical protein